MHSFNIGTVISTAVHEAYPGHYVQFLWVPQAPSRVRKLLGANTDVEGWAHYCEQMMLDEGYGQPGQGAKDERESKFLRLGQLQDALLRNARFIVGIEMHTGKMTFDQAVDFFQKEGYQSKESAMVEAKRGTTDPTYLYYTLGKLEIMKLREDLKKKQGADFLAGRVSQQFPSPGISAHQDRARGAAGRRFADALKRLVTRCRIAVRCGYAQARHNVPDHRSVLSTPQCDDLLFERTGDKNEPASSKSGLSRRRPGHALFAGHQSHPQGNAGAGRQAHHPVRR